MHNNRELFLFYKLNVKTNTTVQGGIIHKPSGDVCHDHGGTGPGISADHVGRIHGVRTLWGRHLLGGLNVNIWF